MDEQIKDLIEATRLQSQYEQERVRLEQERLSIEKQRLETETKRANMLESVATSMEEFRTFMKENAIPGYNEQARLFGIFTEIQRILLIALLSSADKLEEIERLKIIMSAFNKDQDGVSINVKGNVDNITGKRT